MAIRSLEALEKACENKNIYDVILEDDCLERGVTREESEKKMADLYAATSRRERRSAAKNWDR